jgi:hypothetical protein
LQLGRFWTVANLIVCYFHHLGGMGTGFDPHRPLQKQTGKVCA